MGRTDHSRSGKVLLIVLLSVLIVLAGAAVWLWMQPPAQPDVDEGRRIAEAFLADIREGRLEQAWESTTAELKSAEGREAFSRRMRKYPFLKSQLDFVSAQTVTVQDRPRTEYHFRSTGGDSVRLIVANEAGMWKVDRLIVE